MELVGAEARRLDHGDSQLTHALRGTPGRSSGPGHLRHLRNLGLEEELDRESRENEELEEGDHSSMTCRQAYDELMAYLVDNTATASAQDPGAGGENGEGGAKDWVGQSPRAGMAANNDAKLFLAHHESIRILWQVSA